MTERRGLSLGLALLVAGFSWTVARASSVQPAAGPDDVTAFTTGLEATLSAPCDPAPLESSIDFARLVQRGIRDFEPDQEIAEQFTEGIRRGFDLAEAICVDVEAGGSYRLLRVRTIDGVPRALFRLVSADGVNYHDLLLERGDRVQIVDIFVYSNGEWLSQLARRGFLPFAPRAGAGESLFLEHLPEVLRMIQLYREGSHEAALGVFHGLPDGLRKNRNILMQRFAIAIKAGGDEYDLAMVDLKNTFPDDSSLDLVLLDYHFNRGEYDRSLEIIERLNREVGGDPYLDFFRANVLYAAGRIDKAKRAARRAIEAEPGLEGPYWTLVTISLDEKEFAETARLLTEIETRLGIVIGSLEEAPAYSEFVASGAYTRWAASRSAD